MEEISKEDIEQLKRDLYSYGYFNGKIEDVQSRLYNLGLTLKERGEAKGISYGSSCGKSDPYHPSTAALIYEEETLQIELRGWKDKRDKLKLDDKLECLNEEQKELIESHFFYRLTYSFISVNKGYRYQERAKEITNKAIIKMLKKV